MIPRYFHVMIPRLKDIQGSIEQHDVHLTRLFPAGPKIPSKSTKTTRRVNLKLFIVPTKNYVILALVN